MKVCVYTGKGGEGKTPIATNIILDREYAIGTNEHFQLFDTFIPDDRVLALEPDQVFPEIPDDIDIVFDLAGSISAHSGSIVSALKQSDLVIVPITNEVKAIYGGIGTIKEILRFCPNVLVVVTKLEKSRKEQFNRHEWHKSAAFLNVQAQVQATDGLEHIPCLPLKYSKAFDAIFEKELSITQLMEADPLAKYNYAEVSKQFNAIYDFIDGIKHYATEK
jgi:MinD-like ATPase involved in chromosome partitioning or flagellar assembly